jgi:hypothetical protein
MNARKRMSGGKNFTSGAEAPSFVRHCWHG